MEPNRPSYRERWQHLPPWVRRRLELALIGAVLWGLLFILSLPYCLAPA